MNTQSKREKEKEIVTLMISLYCRKHHGGKTLCPECAALDSYARQRSDYCPFMESKT
ncbi:MAG: nitrous oxide-stimulated promoter family protein, partial [Lachnospiraceae bacterium]|nr:nitrous oxide-stimulated promoter family protein [Lachnospiraceae bacterium]